MLSNYYFGVHKLLFEYMLSLFCFFVSAIRYGRMPEAEKKKLVAGLLAGENLKSSSGADLKTLAKHVNTAYLKNLNMTKKKARSILTGKTSCTAVCTQLLVRRHQHSQFILAMIP